MSTVEDVKKTPVFRDLFKDNYITQSVIHVNLRIKGNLKIDLFRIFDKFEVTDKYPFIQYHTIDGQIIFKFDEKNIIEYSSTKENTEVLAKWFETAPYGISFKVKIGEGGIDKFMAINLNENGRIEYKTQWKEEDMATIENIKNTYNFVKDLVEKINKERNKIKFEIPENVEFKYAFINTIQKFILPEKFIINHNDLSEFSRYFYPYVALVIEPRKRLAKIRKEEEKSKFGTYLRYKRVSKYENQARMEQRILYFMRNYDFSDKSLADEISKQFNITVERAMEEIERVRTKYPNIKRSRKILKKLEHIPKYKPPGIGIDIQGKHPERYKIRISGARNKKQLDRIITFMNILIYLYVETYLYKKQERQILKEKLKKLTNIAKRRKRVDEIVDYEKEAKTVKQMAQLDKKRIGFKPEKGQNQWTRSCQNSGHDKKRRPQQYISVYDLKREGFKLNEKTGIYEKTITIPGKRGKKDKVIIRAVGLSAADETGKEMGTIYYSCNPTDNKEHMFIGFLSRSNNPYGQCMPCCFKKDPVISKNKEKRDYFMTCIGKKIAEPKKVTKIVGDKLYILQDTNKIQEGRFGFLPKYLDFFFNQALDNVRKIKHHYLISTKTGYYFKFGTRQDEYPFLNAVASLLDISIDDMINQIIKKLEDDKTDILFTALNNGDIKTQFVTRDKYIKFIKTNNILDFHTINHIVSIPGVIRKNGINIILFEKQQVIIRKALEKEKIRDDFIIICQNSEESDNLVDPNRESIFIIKEIKNYYPIIQVTKKDEMAKDVKIQKIFRYQKEEKNIVNHSLDFYNRNCQETLVKDIKRKKKIIIAKALYKILVGINNKNYTPKYQIVDARNKCKYLITENNTIIPVEPSGSIYNLRILKNIEAKYLKLKDTIKNMNDLYKLSEKKIPIKPIGLYFDTKTNKKAKIVGVMTKTYDVVPIIEDYVEIEWINKQGYVMENKQLYDRIDEEIAKGEENILIDRRIKSVNLKSYMDETYELFRLELSEYLNKPDNEILKKKFEKILSSKKLNKKQKRSAIRKILYRIVDKKLLSIYEKTRKNQKGGAYEKFIHIISKLPNLDEYIINNNRDVCSIHKNKDNCSNNKHCHWVYDKCYLAMTRDMAIKFINKVSEEFVSDELKASELLKIGDYYVSDIVDYNRFTERKGQKIIKSTNYAIDKVLGDLFGVENIPQIGKRRLLKTQEVNLEQMKINNPMNDMGEYFSQLIIENNLSILRAYSNGYFWDKLKYYDLESRNLGYYSTLQTNLANYFRSVIIDWLVDKKNNRYIEDLEPYFDLPKEKDIVKEFILKMTRDITTNTNGVVEYYILNRIYNIPIILYDDNNSIIYIIDNGILYDYKKPNQNIDNPKYSKYKNQKSISDMINIKYNFLVGSNIPVSIEVLYFKL